MESQKRIRLKTVISQRTFNMSPIHIWLYQSRSFKELLIVVDGRNTIM